MSGSALTWAWKQECPSRTAKFILICLANKANGEPRCWPSFGTIAVECGIARRHVPYYIRQLADAGLIEVERRHLNGGALSNGYVLNLGTASDAVGTGTPILGTGGVPTDGEGVSQQRHPNLKKEPIGRKEEREAIASPKKIGRRWAGDVPEEWIAKAAALRLEAGLPAVDARLEAAKFADFWRGKSGQAGAKLDWPATWRNWIRNARPPPSAGQVNGHRAPMNAYLQAGAELVADIARGGRTGGADNQFDNPVAVPLLGGDGRS